ncbi:hypothetical protein [Azospira inquinata]|uniref:Uncharacterized protein n=1 Tax=Azospira inquinata TaxID=2785627 RepID=A0A975SQQ0_9RHOO|nr:hypothetical protein [Azospira inquinata]QWT47145.1 hypothetical protein J8L76_05405 [Azospira inquinata]QWT50225.1 hypothetical protein Azoinq_06465 [Azospira inquinata]
MKRNQVLAALEDTQWAYAPNDQAHALQELAQRIARTGRLNRSLISYSNLVAGVRFQFSNVNNGEPFEIDTHNWHGLHRRIIGDLLGYLSFLSYRDYDFMASALVAGLIENRPSEIFFEWMESLGALPNLSEDAITEFWVGEVNKAVNWYRQNPQGFHV